METNFIRQEDEEMNQEVLAGGNKRGATSQRQLVPRRPPPPSPRDTTDPNWQGNYGTIRGRNNAMYNNDLIADVYFFVGQKPRQQKIPAHKYILSTGSSVFFAMFHGGLANNNKTNKAEVDIPDVEPQAFQNMLKYLYYDAIELEADNVLATLYVAKKYIVPYLAKACVQFLETSLNSKNACVLLSQSRMFDEQDLMLRCWEVIDAQAEEALMSDGFTEIDYQTLQMILARETLHTKEPVMFDAACAWSEAECTRKGLDMTSYNQRKVLGAALYLIRIPAMTLKDYANGPAQCSILTLQEKNDLFLKFTADNKPKTQFDAKPRVGLKSQRCHRFQSSAYRSNQWRYRGRTDSIQFSVDRRIFIAGFGLYGSSNGSTEYKVRIELKRNGIILGQKDTKFYSDGSSSTFPVMFETPTQVEPDSFYTASAILEGPELSYFGQEGMAEVVTGKVTFQYQCSSDSTNGTGVQGGQIPELIFYS